MSLSPKQKHFIKENRNGLSVKQLARKFNVTEEEVRVYQANSVDLAKKREWVFRTGMIALPFLVLLILELSLRLFNYGPDLRIFNTFINDPDYWVTNAFVGKRYFHNNEVLPATSYDAILKQKPENGYRIFVLGGSSAAGYPYYHNGAFSRMLRTRLDDFFPDKHIEIFNLALTATNSFTILDFADELVDYEPDAFLIYAGHNEFYGALGIASTEALGQYRSFVNFYLKLQHLKTFYLVRNVLGWVKGLLQLGEAQVAPDATLMERMVRKQSVVYRSEDYVTAREIFEQNLRDVFEIARSHGIRVIASELVSNLKDQPPFENVLQKTTDADAWNASVTKGQSLFSKKEYLPALNEFEAAIAMDDDAALAHYEKARCLEAMNRFEEAKAAYSKAKDLDALRFRASEEFNESLREVAVEFDVPVIAMRSVFETASPHGLIGNNLMLDHLHPNLRGYFLMAKAFAETMQHNDFIDANWDRSQVKTEEAYWQSTFVTPLDLKVAEIKIDVLQAGWPFVPKSAPNTARNFTPMNKVEEFAWDYFRNEMSWEEVHVAMADYFAESREFAKAAEEYRALIHGTPYNVSPYLRLGLLLLEMQKFREAFIVFSKSLKVEPTAVAQKWIGSIYVTGGRPVDGIRHLEKALEMNPKDTEAMYNLSVAYAMLNQYDEATEYCRKLLTIKPDNKSAQELLQKIKLASTRK